MSGDRLPELGDRAGIPAVERDVENERTHDSSAWQGQDAVTRCSGEEAAAALLRALGFD
jgi:hypothetical protein